MKIVLRFPPEREKSILISLWAKTNGIHTADFFGQLYVVQYFEAAISPKLSLWATIGGDGSKQRVMSVSDDHKKYCEWNFLIFNFYGFLVFWGLFKRLSYSSKEFSNDFKSFFKILFLISKNFQNFLKIYFRGNCVI